MNRFRLLCYLRLKRELGQIDACVECLEIAVREFLRQCAASEDPHEVIKHLSRQHGIRVDAVDVARFRRQCVGLQLVGVTQAFEAFLDAFFREHPRLGSRDGRQNSETLLDFLLRRLKQTQHVKASLEYRLYNYYRLLRNDLAHSSVESADAARADSSSKALDGLRIECGASEGYKTLKAPNSTFNVCFDDYVLFTRAAKRLARTVCDLGELNDEEILDWLRANETRQGNTGRRRNAMTTLLRITFGMTPSEAAPFVDKIVG